tara:strand:+ start:170 stop:415 length:246 start_codon:yes stop_codon:yes gene_type:complete
MSETLQHEQLRQCLITLLLWEQGDCTPNNRKNAIKQALLLIRPDDNRAQVFEYESKSWGFSVLRDNDGRRHIRKPVEVVIL